MESFIAERCITKFEHVHGNHINTVFSELLRKLKIHACIIAVVGTRNQDEEFLVGCNLVEYFGAFFLQTLLKRILCGDGYFYRGFYSCRFSAEHFAKFNETLFE